MAQGLAKLSRKSAKKSAGAQKRKVVKAKTSTKGTKHFTPKKGNKLDHFRQQNETSKAISKKNEVTVAAKAVAVGTQFFLKDIAQGGQNEVNKQMRVRSKKEGKASSMSDRLKGQIKKLVQK